jgi:hypothetical protein
MHLLKSYMNRNMLIRYAVIFLIAVGIILVEWLIYSIVKRLVLADIYIPDSIRSGSIAERNSYISTTYPYEASILHTICDILHIVYIIILIILLWFAEGRLHFGRCDNCYKLGKIKTYVCIDKNTGRRSNLHLCPQCCENFDIRAGKFPPKRSVFLDYFPSDFDKN